MSNIQEMEQELEALKKKVQVLEDKLEIQDVLTRYGLRFDFGYIDEWLKLFADDIDFSTDRQGGLLNIKGIEEMKSYFDGYEYPVKEPTPFFGHIELAGVINLDGDTAVAIGWQLGNGLRLWKLRRTDGKWLITQTVSRAVDSYQNENCRSIVPPNW